MAVEDRPSLIIVRSHIGYGSPHKQDTSSAHGSPLGEDEVRLTKESYGWDPDKHFYVPDEALAHFRECCQRGREFQSEWDERFDAYREAVPRGGEAARARSTPSELPEGWDADLPRFDPGDKPIATRKASEAAIQWAAARVPSLIGGSADLATSTNTDIADGGDVEKGTYGGRNLRFGVREHGMGAIVNGLGLARLPCLRRDVPDVLGLHEGRRAAVGADEAAVVWVWTHDSIGLGEDGPTHQPIEQLAGLRAMPRLNMIRPADANETALGWRFALRNSEAPTGFALSRQNLPILDPAAIPDDAIERGAYVLRDADGGDPELILIGTGSEVSLCLEAADMLDGIRVRVVSMPCMDTFTHADEAYREQVLPAACTARIAVEAASPFGWDKWIGEAGRFVGMETFGESGPGQGRLRALRDHRRAGGRDRRGSSYPDEHAGRDPARRRESARRGPRAAAGPPDRAGDLRRHRRPRPPQAAAGALQPRPRGRAARALRADRGGAAREARRRVPRDGARVDREVLAPRARSGRARRPAARHALRAGNVRRGQGLRRDRPASCASSTSEAGLQHNRIFYLSTAPEFFPIIAGKIGGQRTGRLRAGRRPAA